MTATTTLRLKSNSKDTVVFHGGSEVNITCGNELFTAGAHQLISGSPYFKRQLVTPSGTTDSVTLPLELSPSAVLAALQIIKSGEIQIQESLMAKFEEVAKLMELEVDNDDPSEADTDVGEDLEAPETPVKTPSEVVMFKTMFGDVCFDAGAKEKAEMEVNHERSSSLFKKADSNAVERLFKEISESLPLRLGEVEEEKKNDDDEKVPEVIEDDKEASQTSSLRLEEDANETIHDVVPMEVEDEVMPIVSTPKSSSSPKRRSSSSSGKIRRRRPYNLRFNAELNASKIGGRMFVCKECGYWTYRRHAMTKHSLAKGHC